MNFRVHSVKADICACLVSPGGGFCGSMVLLDSSFTEPPMQMWTLTRTLKLTLPRYVCDRREACRKIKKQGAHGINLNHQADALTSASSAPSETSTTVEKVRSGLGYWIQFWQLMTQEFFTLKGMGILNFWHYLVFCSLSNISIQQNWCMWPWALWRQAFKLGKDISPIWLNSLRISLI